MRSERGAALSDSEAIEQFTELYLLHYRQVYAYAVSRAGSQLAEEIASEVFLITWRRLCDVPAPALPWLLAVARNVVLSQFRAAASRQSVAELQGRAPEPTATADVADEVTERLAVLTALAALSDSDRELLTLVAWHDLSPGQAAQVVGCSTASFFVRLHRARRRLERALGQADAGQPAPGGHAARRLAADPATRHVSELAGPSVARSNTPGGMPR